MEDKTHALFAPLASIGDELVIHEPWRDDDTTTISDGSRMVVDRVTRATFSERVTCPTLESDGAAEFQEELLKQRTESWYDLDANAWTKATRPDLILPALHLKDVDSDWGTWVVPQTCDGPWHYDIVLVFPDDEGYGHSLWCGGMSAWRISSVRGVPCPPPAKENKE
jgi:hypothetical protein